MANALYDLGREGFLDGSIDWDTDDIRVLGLNASYTPNLATHKFVSDLGANIVVRSAALAGRTVASGIAAATATTLTAVTGVQITRWALYKFNASDAAARLIALYDTGTGIPVTPNGGDIVINWPTTGDKVFKL